MKTEPVRPQSYVGEDADRVVASLCPYCGVGCQTTFQVRDNHVLRVLTAKQVAGLIDG